MPLQLIEKLREHARLSPNIAALHDGEDTWTWAELDAASSGVAREIPPGAAVMLCAPNEPAFVAAFLGILRAGAKVFPISPESTALELTAAAQGCNAAGIIANKKAIESLPSARLAIPLADIAAIRHAAADNSPRYHSSAAMLLNSSGTTGRPKIVHRSAKALDAVAEMMTQCVGFSPADRVLAVAPLCHSYGVEHGLLAPIFAGTSVQLLRGFDLPAVLEQLRGAITLFPGVPFMFESLAQSAGDDESFPHLRHAYSAGAPLPAAVAKKFSQCFGLPVAQVYGTTEIGSATFGDRFSPGFNPDAVGKPAPGVSMKITDGQLAFASPAMFDGYLGEQPTDSVSPDGYFLTGDLGNLDAAGNLHITGRLKLLIDVGGQKVNPLEVEQVLSEHPGVADCVVVPMELAATVTRLKAVVTPRPGQTPPTPGDLREFAKARLSAYKIPRVFELRDSLPRSPAGKVLRHLVQESS